MISFSCPKCRTNLERQDAEAGTKALCPGCNQKLLVPTPPRLEKTVLGVLQPAPEPRTMLGQLSSSTVSPPPATPVRAAPPALPVAELCTPPVQPANTEQQPWGFDASTPSPRSRSKPARRTHPLATAAAVVFIGLVGLVVVGGGLASFINSQSWEDREFRRKQQELELKRKEAELDRIRYPALYGGSSSTSTETRPANRPKGPGWNDRPAEPGWNDPPPPRQPATCADCKGSGVSTAVCSSCRGSGVGSSGTRACSVCNGRRFNNCLRCNGSGKGGYFNP